MQGICTSDKLARGLWEGFKYYLFEHGPNNFLVSEYDNVKAHRGSYPREYFKLIDEQPEIEERELFIDGLRVAEVIQSCKGYTFKTGDQYIVGPTSQNRGTHFYIYDDAMQFRGCMPVGMFKIIKLYTGQPIKRAETAKLDVLEPDGIKPLPDVKKPLKTAKIEQMDIFMFLEG